MFLNTDHSGLNKFSGMHDENFALLLPEIQRMVEGGASIVTDRHRRKGTEQTRGTQHLPSDPALRITSSMETHQPSPLYVYILDCVLTFISGMTDQDRREILRWFSRPDLRTKHSLARRKHTESTGLWFTSDVHYGQWKSDPNSFLWISGTRKL